MKAITYKNTDLLPSIPFNGLFQYDHWQLQLRVEFMDMDAPVYVAFKNVWGFRMLYEGDLLNAWNPKTRPKGWLWVVEQGGWFDLEKTRQDFVTGINPHAQLKEYLVLTEEECYSVLATLPPQLVCEDIPEWNF